MTPEARHAAAEELRAIALELNTAQDRLHAIAGLLKESNRVTDSSLAATTAAFHVFSALKESNALAARLGPPVQPAPPEAA